MAINSWLYDSCCFFDHDYTIKEAAEAGVDLHAKAADQSSLELGEAGLTSSDVIEELRYLLKYD